MKINCCYNIKDDFFDKFDDPYLKGNKEEKRPHYFCLRDDDVKGLFWMIPLSRQIERCEGIINKRNAQNRPCDILHILSINGNKSAFLIQDMFPITDEYIKKPYTINGVPLALKDKSDIEAIQKKAKKIYRLIHMGVKLNPTQPDVLKIKNELIAELNSVKPELQTV